MEGHKRNPDVNIWRPMSNLKGATILHITGSSYVGASVANPNSHPKASVLQVPVAWHPLLKGLEKLGSPT